MKTFIILLLLSFAVFAQSKTKITMTVEKDSIKTEELAKLIDDIQKLEKKWKLDIKIEFEKTQEPKSSWHIYGGEYPIFTPNGSSTLEYHPLTINPLVK